MAGTTVGLWPMFLIFAKIGSVLFGSGYVLLAFLARTWWEISLADATTTLRCDRSWSGDARAIIYYSDVHFGLHPLHDPKGALFATLGFFFPLSFLWLSARHWFPSFDLRLSRAKFWTELTFVGFALMIVVTWQLGRAAPIDWWTVGIVVTSL